MRNKKYFLLLLTPLVLFACNHRAEVEQKTMTQVYVNLIIAEETYIGNMDSLVAKRNEIFSRFGISEDDYKYTIESYKADKEYWEEFFPKALAYLDSVRISNSN